MEYNFIVAKLGIVDFIKHFIKESYVATKEKP